MLKNKSEEPTIAVNIPDFVKLHTMSASVRFLCIDSEGNLLGFRSKPTVKEIEGKKIWQVTGWKSRGPDDWICQRIDSGYPTTFWELSLTRIRIDKFLRNIMNSYGEQYLGSSGPKGSRGVIFQKIS